MISPLRLRKVVAAAVADVIAVTVTTGLAIARPSLRRLEVRY
jgi:hypothetical protein